MDYIRGMVRNPIFDRSGTLEDDLPAFWQATNTVLVQSQRSSSIHSLEVHI